jgi:predicted DNA-binding protein (MmcQ/YjbR family)
MLAAMAKHKSHPHTEVLLHLRAFGLEYPGAGTKSPWPGHMDLVVGGKTFAFLSVEGEPLSISCKLDQSRKEALAAPFAQPTGYGLGKSGWVTATFSELEKPPVGLLEKWIDESYRARAGKRLIAQLDGKASAPAAKKPAARPKRRAR